MLRILQLCGCNTQRIYVLSLEYSPERELLFSVFGCRYLLSGQRGKEDISEFDVKQNENKISIV
jgi:hypothetical protein